MSPDLDVAEDADAAFKRSYAALERHFPDAIETLDGIGQPKSRIIGSRAEGDLNLDLGHTTLYQNGAQAFADVQIDVFQERPNRFYMEPPPRRVPPNYHQHHMTEALYAHVEALVARTGVKIAPTPIDRTDGDGGYAIIYGIGLGLHLPALFESAKVRQFVLVEEHAEFLLHALRLNDWDAMLGGLEARGQALHFVIGDDAAVVSAKVHWFLRGRGFGLLDGSYLFRHYSSPLLDYAYDDFVQKLPLLPVSIGYFEDELVMLDQTTTNLMRFDFRYLDVRPRLEKELPAIVIGSGPSLDRTIDDLKRLAPNAVLFSGGTSLLPLLRAGIRPDFHCELENSPTSVEHLQRIAEEFSLDGITLIGSTTVHPELPALFDERIFYFRDSVCSTPLWCTDGTGVFGTAPTCTNLALRAAVIMAFREIYLFGVDLGTRHPAVHHSTNTIYLEDQHWRTHQETEPAKIMNIELAGNFGGKAWTNQILHWARMMMANAIDALSTAAIYNCCDGVSIPGTTPRLARTIRFSGPAALRGVTVARLKRELAMVEPGQFAQVERIVALRSAFQRYYRAMRQEIADARDRSLDFLGFYERILPYLERDGDEPLQPVLRSMNIGTVMMCFQAAYFFWRRVPADAQPGVTQAFLKALDERLASMAASADAIVAKHLPQPATVASINQSTT